jgi:hypothetical protein
MLDPACTGRAFWWGTRGERPWQANELGWIALHAIRERGILIWGEDIRGEVPRVTRRQLVQQVEEFCCSLEAHGEGGGVYAVDWLLTAARELLLLREGRLASKSEATDWGCEHAEGEWRRRLPRAKQLRLHPELVGSGDWRAWLDGLDAPIREAGHELKRELNRQRAGGG